jgi:hypothetical protein
LPGTLTVPDKACRLNIYAYSIIPALKITVCECDNSFNVLILCRSMEVQKRDSAGIGEGTTIVEVHANIFPYFPLP